MPIPKYPCHNCRVLVYDGEMRWCDECGDSLCDYCDIKHECSVFFEVSNTLSAFDEQAIGSRVLHRAKFIKYVAQYVMYHHDTSQDRVAGQHFVSLSEAACSFVSAGVGRRTDSPDDYVLRVHRGQVSAYLKREHAAPVDSVACVVYTRDAYLLDPDVVSDPEEYDRISESNATHVVVAVLASSGPRSPLTPNRFARNLAGGNREATEWTADEIKQKAAASVEYWDEWSVVAD